jgi:hypothetical protein
MDGLDNKKKNLACISVAVWLEFCDNNMIKAVEWLTA